MERAPVRATLLLLAGCALTSKAAPLELRFFSPPSHPVVTPVAEASRTPLRLGRVGSGDLVGTRIIHRASEVEVAPYETLRWTDEPTVYVRRALAGALFEGQPLAQATDGTALTLDVDVLAFEEVRLGQRRLGRVELSYDLRDDTHVIAHGAVRVERDAGPDGIEHVVTAIGAALDAAAVEIAARVASKIPLQPVHGS
jgi:cholesterol transport system auxiliary component